MDEQKSHIKVYSSSSSHVKGDKYVPFLLWDYLEPFYGLVSAFPQIHFGHFNDFFVYAVKDVFAVDANFRSAWIDESAGRVVDAPGL